jgi:hypothetical protein
MSQEFDPYLHWLGITKNEPRPLSFYRLLGVERFEAQADVIASNADKQIEHVRRYSKGPHGDLAERMITELTKAKLTLLKPDRRAKYDLTLQTAATAAPKTSPQDTRREPPPSQSSPIQEAPNAKPPLSSPPAAPPVTPLPFVPPPQVLFPPAAHPPVLSQTAAAPPLSSSPPPHQVTPPHDARLPSVPRTQLAEPPLTPPRSSPYPPGYVPPEQRRVAAPGSADADAPPRLVQDLRETVVRLWARVWNSPQRGLYLSLIIGGALAIVVGGTAVGIAVARYGFGTDSDETLEANAEPDPAPAETPNEPAPQNFPKVLAPTNVEFGPYAEEPIVVMQLPPGARFDWPPVENPRVPQVVEYFDQNGKPLTMYRYPRTNPHMATIISRGHVAGCWSVEGRELIFDGPRSANEFLLFGDPSWTNYTFEFEALTKNSRSMHPLGVLYRCLDDHNLELFLDEKDRASLLNWRARWPNFDVVKDDTNEAIKPAPNEFARPGEWKKYRVTVSGSHVVAERDGKILIDTLAYINERGCVGINLQPLEDGQVRLRRMRVTTPEGGVLWQGIPQLPPSLRRAATRLWPRPDLSDWTILPKPVKPGQWHVIGGKDDGPFLQALGAQNPPLLITHEYDYGNYFLEVKFRKMRGEFDLHVAAPHNPVAVDRLGMRFHVVYVKSEQGPAAAEYLVLQLTKASDGYHLRLNGETVIMRGKASSDEFPLPPTKGRIGFDVKKPDSEVMIEEITVRRAPDTLRLYDEQFEEPADDAVRREVGPGWQVVIPPPPAPPQ